MSLKDKVILIVGSTSGIGEVVALEAAKEGAKVIVSGRREDKGNKVVEKIRFAGGRAEFVKCDARIEEDVKTLVEKSVSIYGRLDGAFNNVGINQEFKGMKKEGVRNLIESNLESVLWCLKYELIQMKKQDKQNGTPSIVNNGTALVARPVGTLGLYAATKAAVNTLSQVAAIESAPHVRVNVVNAGATRGTELFSWTGQKEPMEPFKEKTLLKRIAEPEDVAKSVIFLLSDHSSWVTGTAIQLDGGSALS